MASSSSTIASTSKSSSEANIFYHEFNERLQGVEKLIRESKTVDELQEIVSKISEARIILTEKTAILPSYDQQIHEQSLKRVNDYLQIRRVELKPKGRFAFKRTARELTENSVKPETNQNGNDIAIPLTTDTSSEEKDLSAVRTEHDSIRDVSGEHITSIPSNLPSSDLHLINLRDCFVDLRQLQHKIKALQIRNVSKCVILAGQIDGSVMINDCEKCLFVMECRQFRMHSSNKVTVLLSTNSIATIEHCKDVRFGQVNNVLLGNDEEVEKVNGSSFIPKVQDFDHISSLTPSPNWHLIEEAVLAKINVTLSSKSRTARDVLTILDID